MNHSSKSTSLSKMIFWISKEILEDYLPWESQPQSFSGSWNMPASVFWEFWMIQKNFFEKISESTQNRSIRKINMFWAIFEILTFFLKEPPRLVIFRPKNEIFRFWPSIAILMLLVTQVDLIKQNKAVMMAFNIFCTFWQSSMCEIKYF